jgi:hypothetical protein
MAVPPSQLRRPQGRQSSQSSYSWQSSSPWNRESSSSPAPDTQEVRDGVIELMNLSARNARRGRGGNSREAPDPDGIDMERPSKHRCDLALDVRKVLVLTLHILDDRKTSPTQPGRGIRKIVDLYHDLSDLLNKAKKHSTIVNELNPAMIEEMDRIDFVGMSEDEIEEEQKEYARALTCDLGVTDTTSAANGVTQP